MFVTKFYSIKMTSEITVFAVEFPDYSCPSKIISFRVPNSYGTVSAFEQLNSSTVLLGFSNGSLAAIDTYTGTDELV